MPLDRLTEEVLAGGWHWIGHASEFRRRVTPVVLLPGSLDEPLVVVRGEDDRGWRGLSNVCTHRGAVVVERACDERRLVCPYHGRRFDTEGRMVAARGFDGVEDFPTPADDLRSVALGVWRGLLFASVEPSMTFEDWIAPVAARCAHLPWDELDYAPDRSRDHVLEADWRIYCENYLEGFHIPYVHPELARTVALDRYTTEPQGHACLQLARARDGDEAMLSGDGSECIAAWYWFLFPATMLNVYPWGVSVNAVETLGPALTRVRFRSLVWDASKLDRGAGGALDLVEQQDQAVVRAVARGTASRLYRPGRLHPMREAGVAWFRALLHARS